MNLTPINPYNIIKSLQSDNEELVKKNKELEKENEELKERLNVNTTMAGSNN